MPTVEELAEAIKELTDEERARLMALLDELEEDAWDRQIEEDARSGKLDWLLEEGRREAREGLLRDL